MVSSYMEIQYDCYSHRIVSIELVVVMKAGDMVKRKNGNGKFGLFMGFRTSGDYEYAEVLWIAGHVSNGDIVSSIQKNLLEVISETS